MDGLTIEQRRARVIARLWRAGSAGYFGKSRAYFIGLANAAGYNIVIDDAWGLTVARAGRACAGDPCNGEEWAHVWTVDVAPPLSERAVPRDDLVWLLKRDAPSHTYPVIQFLDE